MLSYTKLLEIVFKALSFGTLNYPNGEEIVLWLPDASVKFLNGKHIILFIVALLILIAGVLYTIIVFSWQWLVHLPEWRVFIWIRNPRIQTFTETYHVPYTAKYRYWTGLLLIVRAVLYLVSATDVSNDPQVVLTSIIITVGSLLFLKGRLYKSRDVNLLESFFYFNLLLVSAVTWYSLGHPDRNWTKEVPYMATFIAFVLLMFIVIYHTYTPLCMILRKTNIGKFLAKFNIFKSDQEPRPLLCNQLSPDDNDYRSRFHEMEAIIDTTVNTSDYK